MGHTYTSKMPDTRGNIQYDPVENNTWARLVERQLKNIPERACDEYLEGLKKLDLPVDRVPQHFEITEVLQKNTGWAVQVVPAIIPADEFFNLLAHKKFPVASFVRIPEEFDYLEEPDIFHEVFGHCPLLTHEAYAEFMCWYGKTALLADQKTRNRLFRLFWFTIEFGLLKTQRGFRAYGGGILSSPKETLHAIDSEKPQRIPLDALDALRTPFRIDIVQPLYFYIEKLEELFKLTDLNLIKLVEKSHELGSFPKAFPSKEEYPGDGYHGHNC